MKFFQFLTRLRKLGAFAPEAFLARAAILTLLFAISRLAGLQEYTTFLSGTSPNLNVSWRITSSLGLIHLALYFSFILLVPIFAMTAALLALWNHLVSKRHAAIPIGLCETKPENRT